MTREAAPLPTAAEEAPLPTAAAVAATLTIPSLKVKSNPTEPLGLTPNISARMGRGSG